MWPMIVIISDIVQHNHFYNQDIENWPHSAEEAFSHLNIEAEEEDVTQGKSAEQNLC